MKTTLKVFFCFLFAVQQAFPLVPMSLYGHTDTVHNPKISLVSACHKGCGLSFPPQLQLQAPTGYIRQYEKFFRECTCIHLL